MRTALLALAGTALLAGGLPAQDDVADIKSEDIRIGGDEHRRYFRIGPREGKAPKDGYGLLVILPGGGGGADFHAFCKRIYKNACDDSFVAVQPVSVMWTEGQESIWPTAKSRVEGMKFTTEEFVEEVIADAAKWQTIDPARIYVLAWSSSGPAAYAISLSRKKSPTGFFIAMSVFKPDYLPNLREAKGEAYYLYHSPEDRVCPYRMAEDAARQLKKKGARVAFAKYAGGHGWRGPLYADLKAGIAWLEKNHAKPRR